MPAPPSSPAHSLLSFFSLPYNSVLREAVPCTRYSGTDCLPDNSLISSVSGTASDALPDFSAFFFIFPHHCQHIHDKSGGTEAALLCSLFCKETAELFGFLLYSFQGCHFMSFHTGGQHRTGQPGFPVNPDSTESAVCPSRSRTSHSCIPDL